MACCSQACCCCCCAAEPLTSPPPCAEPLRAAAWAPRAHAVTPNQPRAGGVRAPRDTWSAKMLRHHLLRACCLPAQGESAGVAVVVVVGGVPHASRRLVVAAGRWARSLRPLAAPARRSRTP